MRVFHKAGAYATAFQIRYIMYEHTDSGHMETSLVKAESRVAQKR